MRRFVAAKANHALSQTEETKEALNTAFALVVGQHKPACFRESGQHVLTMMEKGYARILIGLSENGCHNPDRLTVFELFSWLDYLEEKFESIKPKKHATK